MSDATNAAAERADSSARNAENLTDEQLWDEMEREDRGSVAKPDEEDGQQPDEGQQDATSDDDGGRDDDAPPDDPDGSSEGEGEGKAAASDGGTDGTDPKELQAQIERLQHQFQSEQGRTRAKQREIERLETELSTARNTSRPDKQDEDDLKKRQEKLDAARAEYGDVIGPLADIITEQQAHLDQLSAREKQELEANQARYQELLDEEHGVFISEHPDGLDTIAENRAAFDAWIEDQPKRLRDIYAANEHAIVDGNAAALLVSEFKQELLGAQGSRAPDQETRLQTRRQRQLAGAHSTRSQGRQQASSVPPKDLDDPAAHWDYFERLDRQQGGRR